MIKYDIIGLKYDKIILNWCISTKFHYNSLNLIMKLGIWKKNPTSKYLRWWNLSPKPNLVITFWAILLMIIFEELILIFYIWVPKTLLLLLGVWPKNYGFSILEHFLCILDHACSLTYKSKSMTLISTMQTYPSKMC